MRMSCTTERDSPQKAVRESPRTDLGSQRSKQQQSRHTRLGTSHKRTAQGRGWEHGRGPGPGLGVCSPLAGHVNWARHSLCLGFLTYKTKTIIMVPSSWVTGAGPGCREVPAEQGDHGSCTRAAHRSYPSSSHSDHH